MEDNWGRGGKGNPFEGSIRLGRAKLSNAVFLSAENMAAQREWTPMVSSR